MNREKRQKIEEKFHDRWAMAVDPDKIRVEKYFLSPTAVEFKYISSLIGNVKNKIFLDLGCGFGEASTWFAMNGAKVFSLDISSNMLSCAQKLAKKYKVKLTLIKSAAENIPLNNESVDIVFGGSILHHTDVEKTAKEIRRVLKKGGKAFFVEPLSYNPLIKIYRSLAKEVRTPTEKPFTFKDIKLLESYFRQCTHKEFHLFTTLIFVWFFIGERLHPGKTRYWRKFIEEGDKYERAFLFLSEADKFFLKIPFLRKYCWNTVIELVK